MHQNEEIRRERENKKDINTKSKLVARRDENQKLALWPFLYFPHLSQQLGNNWRELSRGVASITYKKMSGQFTQRKPIFSYTDSVVGSGVFHFETSAINDRDFGKQIAMLDDIDFRCTLYFSKKWILDLGLIPERSSMRSDQYGAFLQGDQYGAWQNAIAFARCRPIPFSRKQNKWFHENMVTKYLVSFHAHINQCALLHQN